MNKAELLEKFKDEKVPEWLYGLDGVLKYTDGFVLNQDGDSWEVYYEERGKKDEIKSFVTLEDACNYLYKRVREEMEYL